MSTAPPAARPAPRYHHWGFVTREESTDLHVLEYGERPGFDTLVFVGSRPAVVHECQTCGLREARVSWLADALTGRREHVMAYGLSEDTMAVMHRAPPCDPLHTREEIDRA